MASNNFINICKEPANANRLATITKVSDSTILTQDDYIQDFTIDKGCYSDGSIIGTIYVEKINANLIGSYGINLENEDIKVQVGIKYDDDTTEYIDLGKYKVEKPKDEATNNYSTVIAYSDLLNKLDSVYECNLDFTIEKTFLDLYNDLCNNLGLISKTTSFTNDNLILAGNPFTNGETNRMVLQSIEKASCTFAQINSETNEIELCWLSQSEEPDYTFDLNDYSTLNGGKIVYGPINSLVIKMNDVDDENVSISDDDSIAQNGEHQLIINEDYLLYTPELREQAINAIWDKVHNLTYVDCELTTYYGKPFLKIGDKIRIYKDEETYFDTYVLTHQFKYDGSFYSKITSPVLTAQQVATKQDISLGELLKLTKIQVNKIAGEIDLIAQQSEEASKAVAQIKLDSENVIASVESMEKIIFNTINYTLTEDNVFLEDKNYYGIDESGNYVYLEPNVDYQIGDEITEDVYEENVIDGLEERVSRNEINISDQETTINIISTNIDTTTGDIQSVKTTTGYTLDKDGLKIEKSSEDYNTKIDNTGTYYKDGDTILGQTTKDGSVFKDMILYGKYYYGVDENLDVANFKKDDAMFVSEKYEDANGEVGFGHFYNGGN